MKKILIMVVIGIFILSTFSAVGNVLEIKSSSKENIESYIVCLNSADYKPYKINTKATFEENYFYYFELPRDRLTQAYDYVIITDDDLINSIT